MINNMLLRLIIVLGSLLVHHKNNFLQHIFYRLQHLDITCQYYRYIKTVYHKICGKHLFTLNRLSKHPSPQGFYYHLKVIQQGNSSGVCCTTNLSLHHFNIQAVDIKQSLLLLFVCYSIILCFSLKDNIPSRSRCF